MNGDVFPPMNLPDDGKGQSAVPWGRAVQDRVVTVEGRVEALSQALGGQNRSNASSIQNLAQQISDLSGRVGYSTDSTLTQTWTSDQPTDSPWGPVLNFDLTEPRVISIQFSVLGRVLTVAQSTSSAAFATLRAMIFVNGSGVGGSRGEIATNVGIAPTSYRASDLTNTLVSRVLVSLPAGSHVIQGGFAARYANTIGSPASAQITASNPAIFLDVLQPS